MSFYFWYRSVCTSAIRCILVFRLSKIPKTIAKNLFLSIIFASVISSPDRTLEIVFNRLRELVCVESVTPFSWSQQAPFNTSVLVTAVHMRASRKEIVQFHTTVITGNDYVIVIGRYEIVIMNIVTFGGDSGGRCCKISTRRQISHFSNIMVYSFLWKKKKEKNNCWPLIAVRRVLWIPVCFNREFTIRLCFDCKEKTIECKVVKSDKTNYLLLLLLLLLL